MPQQNDLTPVALAISQFNEALAKATPEIRELCQSVNLRNLFYQMFLSGFMSGLTAAQEVYKKV